MDGMRVIRDLAKLLDWIPVTTEYLLQVASELWAATVLFLMSIKCFEQI
jgi:hypothetical protein